GLHRYYYLGYVAAVYIMDMSTSPAHYPGELLQLFGSGELPEQFPVCMRYDPFVLVDNTGIYACRCLGCRPYEFIEIEGIHEYQRRYNILCKLFRKHKIITIDLRPQGSLLMSNYQAIDHNHHNKNQKHYDRGKLPDQPHFPESVFEMRSDVAFHNQYFLSA